MLNSLFLYTESLKRFAILFILAFGLFMSSGCALLGTRQKTQVPPLLTPLNQAKTDQLIAEINRVAAVRSIRGKVDIQFQDTSFAESGIAEKYRTADASVILQRPGQVLLLIEGPFSVNIAQMSSDGEHFRVAVLRGEEQYRRFVRGTNSAVYPKLSMDETESGARGKNKKTKTTDDQRTVSALSNLRPQHLTDAFLIRPVQPRADSGLIYAQSEFYEEEADTRPRAKERARVVRGYYFLDELAPGNAGGARLLRRFWFDRVGGIRLARLQTYDDDGTLVTDVVYGETKNFGENGNVMLPARVELTRPQDRYKLSLTYQSPEAVVIDRTYDPAVFVLENKWQLPEINLDERQNRVTKSNQ